NGKFVYVIDANKYIRLRLADGKVTLKKKLPTNMYSATMAVDKKGSLYAIGYYGATLYKISSRGDIIWKHVFSADYYWPSKITLSGRKVVVAFDGDPKFAKAKVDARTGK
ncbi:MAG: hypothetical protein Q4G47_06420, partial [Lachnospiraceae bacterium]|nr:hypothetical protein [Lachnospiraceae bacterium]